MIGESVELKLSHRVTVKVAELDGFELDKADAIVAAQTTPIKDGERNPRTGEVGKPVIPFLEMGFKQPRIYAICSIRELNGDKVLPLKGGHEYQHVASKLGGAELRVLMDWAQPIYSPKEEDVKNEEAAQP